MSTSASSNKHSAAAAAAAAPEAEHLSSHKRLAVRPTNVPEAKRVKKPAEQFNFYSVVVSLPDDQKEDMRVHLCEPTQLRVKDRYIAMLLLRHLRALQTGLANGSTKALDKVRKSCAEKEGLALSWTLHTHASRAERHAHKKSINKAIGDIPYTEETVELINQEVLQAYITDTSTSDLSDGSDEDSCSDEEDPVTLDFTSADKKVELYLDADTDEEDDEEEEEEE
jgi:hypothetical protein